jgi:hypothetical protein
MMSEEEAKEAYDACTTDEERKDVIRELGDQMSEAGDGVLDADTLEIILKFCEVAVKTTLLNLAKGLDHPDSEIRYIDAEMMFKISIDPPPIARESVFKMVDMMGLTIGDPNATPEATDAALAAMLDGES